MIDLIERLKLVDDYIHDGGWVMIPLITVSVVMWVLIINRAIFFRRLYRKNMTRERAGEYVKDSEYPNPKEYRGATYLLVTSFLRRRTGNTAVDRHILDETVISLVSSLENYLSVISALARICPLLGLLGTVTGMILTFDIISLFGTGNARAMADGISEALITTQTGLLIAIPGIYMSNFLKGRAENLKTRIASVGIYLQRFL